MMTTSSGDRLLAQCQELAACSESKDYLCRRYLTPEHQQANLKVTEWMQAAGLLTQVDAAGNLWGRAPGLNPQAPALVLGSHLDTVRDAGRYDGMLGVLASIEALRALHQQGVKLPFPVEVVGFADEEGTRFGTTLLGSRAVAGSWQDDWFALQDEQGISLHQALLDFGLQPKRIAEAARKPEQLAAYLEVHIEQGPVLESQGLPLGIVTAIAGAKRLQFSLSGQAGHAGTTPMDLRQDALAGAAEMVLSVEQLAQAHQVVATVGQLKVAPGAVNVIPGQVTFSLDLRSSDDQRRDAALDAILDALKTQARDRQLQLDWQEIHQAPAIACDPQLQETLAGVLRNLGLPDFRLPSGAGHDAMAMASLGPAAMLFVRCQGGISHNPLESICSEDAEIAVQALIQFLTQYRLD